MDIKTYLSTKQRSRLDLLVVLYLQLFPLSAQPSYTRGATQLEDILPSSPEASSRVRYADVPCAGGRLTPDGALHYVTDHLGSVRAVVDGSAAGPAATPPSNILAVSDYSPYGERSQGAAASLLTLAQAPAGTTLRHRFTAQEDQWPDFIVPYTDFGARQYNVNLRRWMVPDPMGEAYYDISPYVYCAGDPVNLVDPDGNIIGWPPILPYRYVGRAMETYGTSRREKTVGYAIQRPVTAVRVGFAKEGVVPNWMISQTASNFAVNISIAMGYSDIPTSPYANAIRHTVWQAIITRDFGEATAQRIGNVHEDSRKSVDYDREVDIKNNVIGRQIGVLAKGKTNREIAEEIIEYYKEHGLWHVINKGDETYSTEQHRLTIEEFKEALTELLRLNDFGKEK